jgi:hypothetical protein
VLALLNTGRVNMAATLVEQALGQIERQKPTRAASPTRRGGRGARP